MIDRRRFLQGLGTGVLAFTTSHRGMASETVPLQVAYAGSMGAVMDGGVRPAVARALGVALRGRAQGASALARLIVARTIRPDVFISVTPGPMQLVLNAGLASHAVPIARTEMVIAYSPRGPHAETLARSATTGAGHMPWYQALETRGLRFGRTNPDTDPQGKNTLFMLALAARYYHVPDLVTRIAGPTINSAQIFPEADVMARLQSGELDASAAYKTQPPALGLPWIALPDDINLGNASLEAHYRRVSLTLSGKTSHPEPLVFYAATLTTGAHPALAAGFVDWLRSDEGQAILRRGHYDPPKGAVALTPHKT